MSEKYFVERQRNKKRNCRQAKFHSGRADGSAHISGFPLYFIPRLILAAAWLEMSVLYRHVANVRNRSVHFDFFGRVAYPPHQSLRLVDDVTHHWLPDERYACPGGPPIPPPIRYCLAVNHHPGLVDGSFAEASKPPSHTTIRGIFCLVINFLVTKTSIYREYFRQSVGIATNDWWMPNTRQIVSVYTDWLPGILRPSHLPCVVTAKHPYEWGGQVGCKEFLVFMKIFSRPRERHGRRSGVPVAGRHIGLTYRLTALPTDEETSGPRKTRSPEFQTSRQTQLARNIFHHAEGPSPRAR